MGKIKKIISGMLAAIFACAFAACAPAKAGDAPDYSAYSDRFSYYAYNPPNSGTWRDMQNHIMYAGEDFRTVARYREYKDCGFDILMLQTSGNYYGQAWETCDTKLLMDRAQEAGIDKVIVTDNRLQILSRGYAYVDEAGNGKYNGATFVDLCDEAHLAIDPCPSLIGAGKPFADEDALDKYVAACMEPYRTHPVFYGVQLFDEPRKQHIAAYGEVYRAIKRVCPEAFAQYNLFQMHIDSDSPGDVEKKYENVCPAVEGEFANNDERAAAMYEAYVKAFAESTGADYVMMDSYPLLGSGVRECYIRNMQICAEVGKEMGIDFASVVQTFSDYRPNGSVVTRRLNEAGARWLNNMQLGFGVKQIVYYTYWSKGKTGSFGTDDKGSFITLYGEKTALYGIMQKIMAENQTFANTILQFDYVTSNVYTVKPSVYSVSHASMASEGKAYQKVKNVAINKECALVTELHDDENERYMYMVQNIVDPVYQGANAYQTATVTFKKGFTHALVYKNGTVETVKLQNGKYTVKQHAGEAVFILPY